MKPLRITLFALLLAGCTTPIPPPGPDEDEKAIDPDEKYVVRGPANWLPTLTAVAFLPDGKRAVTASANAAPYDSGISTSPLGRFHRQRIAPLPQAGNSSGSGAQTD